MDSDALNTFLMVHHRGGISNAAKALHRTQPAISRRIALLEQELGGDDLCGASVAVGGVSNPHPHGDGHRAGAALADDAEPPDQSSGLLELVPLGGLVAVALLGFAFGSTSASMPTPVSVTRTTA